MSVYEEGIRVPLAIVVDIDVDVDVDVDDVVVVD
jgi:hypothetical protein